MFGWEGRKQSGMLVQRKRVGRVLRAKNLVFEGYVDCGDRGQKRMCCRVKGVGRGRKGATEEFAVGGCERSSQFAWHGHVGGARR